MDPADAIVMCYQTSMTQRPADVPPIDEWTALLLGKVAVITGGGDGIGAAIATMFARLGPQRQVAGACVAREALVVGLKDFERGSFVVLQTV